MAKGQQKRTETQQNYTDFRARHFDLNPVLIYEHGLVGVLLSIFVLLVFLSINQENIS